jgi:hypothetical protein
VTLTVIEPHLSAPGHLVAIDYLAFPVSIVLSAALGPDWRTKAETIEFRAHDGYVSRIEAARLTARVLTADEFVKWTLEPSAAKPDTPCSPYRRTRLDGTGRKRIDGIGERSLWQAPSSYNRVPKCGHPSQPIGPNWQDLGRSKQDLRADGPISPVSCAGCAGQRTSLTEGSSPQ